MKKMRCIYKIRNITGDVIGFLLKDENEQVIEVNCSEIREMMASGDYEFTDLEINEAGCIVDKAELVEE